MRRSNGLVMVSVRMLYRILLVALAMVVFMTSSASALSSEQLRLFNSGIFWYDVHEAACSASIPTTASGPSLKTGDKLYILGDSITVRAAQNYSEQFATRNVEAYINGKVSRSWNSAGSTPGLSPQGTNSSGLDAVETDRDFISTANGVVIALGSNGGVGGNPIDDVVAKIREYNASNIPIWWVNTIVTPGSYDSLGSSLGEFNAALSARQDITVIDWFKAVDPSGNSSVTPGQDAGGLLEDGLHPVIGAGTSKLAELVVSTTFGSGSGTPTTSGGGCTCGGSSVAAGASRDERYRATWAYFIGKGLSAEATAGVMGNLEAESGIDPHNTEDTAPVPDGPEIPIEAIRSKWGYGIAQWTYYNRQEALIAMAQSTGRSTGDLILQLDYLWYELENNYTGVMAVLQTPGVTLADASYSFLADFETPEPFTSRGTQAQRDRATAERLAKGTAIFNEFSGQNIAGGFGGSGGCASSPATGNAANYIKDCSLNGGNAMIACKAINELSGIPYSQTNRPSVDDPNPATLDCSGLTNMAIYRTFGHNPGLCSVEYRTSNDFQEIDVHDIQPGDLVGRGTACSDEGHGHIAIVVSYDAASKKLVTVEASSARWPSGVRDGGEGSYSVGLAADGNGSYEWAVRYIGPKT